MQFSSNLTDHVKTATRRKTNQTSVGIVHNVIIAVHLTKPASHPSSAGIQQLVYFKRFFYLESSLVEHDEDEVEAREQRTVHLEVLRHSPAAVVVSCVRVRRGQDGSATGQGADHACLRQADALLFHRFEQSGVLGSHLVELVDATAALQRRNFSSQGTFRFHQRC